MISLLANESSGETMLDEINLVTFITVFGIKQI